MQSTAEGGGDEFFWSEYLQAFPTISEEGIRVGCHPRKMVHLSAKTKAIVLVHGLTDSPHFMKSVALYFHEELGYNVYLPLLQCHGLKEPQGMNGVALTEWKKSIRFAVHSAGLDGAKVSIGGFSLGGILSLYMACTEAAINGHLYLFAAALGLSPGPCGIPGYLKEFLLRLPFAGLFDNGRPLIGNNPYRYDRVSVNGARELSRLMREMNEMLRKCGMQPRRIFAAWSENDTVISQKKLRDLKWLIGENLFFSFVIPAKNRVDHASLMLKEPIFADDAQPGQLPLEPANPCFREMIAAIGHFEASG